MDLEFSDTQSALLDSLRSLLARHAGPARARQVMADGQCDRDLLEALGAAGFLDLASSEGAGPLEAELVVEEVARAAGVVPAGPRSLVAPMLTDQHIPQVVAICEATDRGPVRFAAAADLVVVLDGDSAGILRPEPGEIPPVDSPYGPAMGYVPRRPPDELPGVSARTARLWWRVAIAAEIAGRLGAALDLTVRYAKEADRVVPDGAAPAGPAPCRCAAIHVARARCRVERGRGDGGRRRGPQQRDRAVGLGRAAPADGRHRLHRGVRPASVDDASASPAG